MKVYPEIPRRITRMNTPQSYKYESENVLLIEQKFIIDFDHSFQNKELLMHGFNLFIHRSNNTSQNIIQIINLFQQQATVIEPAGQIMEFKILDNKYLTILEQSRNGMSISISIYDFQENKMKYAVQISVLKGKTLRHFNLFHIYNKYIVASQVTDEINLFFIKTDDQKQFKIQFKQSFLLYNSQVAQYKDHILYFWCMNKKCKFVKIMVLRMKEDDVGIRYSEEYMYYYEGDYLEFEINKMEEKSNGTLFIECKVQQTILGQVYESTLRFQLNRNIDNVLRGTQVYGASSKTIILLHNLLIDGKRVKIVDQSQEKQSQFSFKKHDFTPTNITKTLAAELDKLIPKIIFKPTTFTGILKLEVMYRQQDVKIQCQIKESTHVNQVFIKLVMMFEMKAEYMHWLFSIYDNFDDGLLEDAIQLLTQK